MSSKPISELNPLTAPLAADVLPIVNSFETKKVTVTNLLRSNVGTFINFTVLDSTDSPYTLSDTDACLLVDGEVTINLPAAAASSGRSLRIKNIGTGTVTLDGNGGETIDDSETQPLTQYSCAHIICDGSEWWII